MNKVLLLPFFLVLILNFNSCQKDPNTTPPNNTNNNGNNGNGGNGNATNQVFTTIDFSNANSLIITRNPNTGSKTLYKTTTNNNLEEIVYFDQNGDTMISAPKPSILYNINSQYLVVTFEYESKGYLVRKSDGKVYDMTSIGTPPPYFIINDGQWNGPRNRPRIQSGGNGHIYFISGYDAPIVKADISNPNAITGSTHTYTDDNVRNFIVTQNGDVAYTSWGTVAGNRLKKADGGIYTLPNSNYWLDLSNHINHAPNVYWNSQTNSNVWDVVTLTIDASTGNVSENTRDVGMQVRTDYGSTYEFVFSDKIIMVNSDIMEVDNSSNQVILSNYTITGTLKYADASNDYLYVLTENGGDKILTKIDKNNYTDQALVSMSTDGYDIYQFTVDNSNVITFFAIQTSNGNKVIGKIDVSGNISIMNGVNVSGEIQQIEHLD